MSMNLTLFSTTIDLKKVDVITVLLKCNSEFNC